METHRHLLSLKCRTCGRSLKNDKRSQPASKLYEKVQIVWNVNVNLDSADVHPSKICGRCFSKTNNKLYLQGKYLERSVLWKPHNDDCEVCFGTKRGRTTKKRKLDVSKGLESCSDTDSAEENFDEDMQPRRVYCIEMDEVKDSFAKVSTEDKVNIMKELLKDTEVKAAVLSDLIESAGCIIIEKTDLHSSIAKIPVNLLSDLVKHIFSSQRESIVKDIHCFSQTYKDISCLKGIDCKEWLERRNPIIVSAIQGLNTSSSHFLSCLALEQLYGLCGLSSVLPFSFMLNLVILAVSNSKLAVNLVSKALPGGSYNTLRSWMDSLSSSARRFPSGDCEVAVDNDQVVKKNWKVRVGQKSRVSIITSVCQVEVNPDKQLQKCSELSPRHWKRAVTDKDLPMLAEAMRFEDYGPLRKENKKLLQECLEKVYKEQDVAENGSCSDDLDLKIKDIEKKKLTRVCPNCGTEMPKQKRKCINPDCRVDLKSAEAQLTGEDILGTALLAPVRQHQSKYKISEVVFNKKEDTEKTIQTVVTRFQQFDIEWPHVPSGHPDGPVKISVSDPVFVNPATYRSVAEVLRHVGKIARVTRYCPSEDDTRAWIPVTMDGSPYSIAESLITSTHICIPCSEKDPDKPCEPLLLKEWETHVKNVHGGVKVASAKEFDWVLLRIGPLHVEMNMLKTFLAVNWNVTMSALACEMGFTSPSAQNYAKSGTNHHHAQTFLKTMLEGSWCELLVPYVREQIQNGKKEGKMQQVSVNDYVYRWLDTVKNPNYLFQVEMLWRYAGAFQVYHIGIRRNNPEYVRAGLLAFAPLFSWRPFTSKYQLIELQDRCQRCLAPQKVKKYLEATESFSTSGNPSKGEGLDAQLEEVNKESKVWEHGAMTAREWQTIMRNHDDLNEIRTRLFTLIGFADPKKENIASRPRDDLENEVLAWRVRLRHNRYFLQPHEKADHVTLGGKVLDKDLINITKITESNRTTVLKEVIIGKKKRTTLPLQEIYILEADRVEANKISNLTKDAILNKAESKISTIVEMESRESLMMQLNHFKAKKNSTLKESLICFYNEVVDSVDEINVLATNINLQDDNQ